MKMKICSKCNNQIPKELKICPNCGAKQRNKVVVGLCVFLVVMIAMVVALVFSKGTDNNSISNDLSQNNTSATKEITINDTSVVDDFECKIKEVNWYSPADFDLDLLQKEEGFEYIVVVLTEKNTTNDTENAPMVNILSADDKQCVSKPVLNLYKNQYKANFGATMANETAEAYFIYQIPSGAKSFKMQILSNSFGKSSECFVFDRDDIK